MFTGLDHIAIAVPNTDEAIRVCLGGGGFPVLFSEVVNNGTTKLTHLDMGNTHLQLVEPLTEDHPLKAWLAANGPGLHHICLGVENIDTAVEQAAAAGIPAGQAQPHQGTRGKRATFLSQQASGNIRVELTGE
jgi:methylmalonyl-CoA/ethylmalonyl-CoA epimerase